MNGYICQIQKMLPWQKNSYLTIPTEINHLCLEYYCPIKISFNTDIANYVGNDIQFVNEKTIKKSNRNRQVLCAIQQAILADICDI